MKRGLLLATILFVWGTPGLAAERLTEAESLTVKETPEFSRLRQTRQQYVLWFTDRVADVPSKPSPNTLLIQVRFAPCAPDWSTSSAGRDSVATLVAGTTAVLAARQLLNDWQIITLQFAWSEAWSQNPNGTVFYSVQIPAAALHNPIISVAQAKQLITSFPPDPP